MIDLAMIDRRKVQAIIEASQAERRSAEFRSRSAGLGTAFTARDLVQADLGHSPERDGLEMMLTSLSRSELGDVMALAQSGREIGDEWELDRWKRDQETELDEFAIPHLLNSMDLGACLEAGLSRFDSHQKRLN